MLWYYIPPTEQQELLFAAGKEYDKGQVIMGKKRISSENDFISKSSSTRTTGKNTRNMIMLFLTNPYLG
jgi:hypothetical protein